MISWKLICLLKDERKYLGLNLKFLDINFAITSPFRRKL